MVRLDAVLVEVAGLLSSPKDSVETTSTTLGERLGVSQQTASRYLKDLEKEGFIERKITGFGQRIRLTGKALERLHEIRARLDSLLKQKPAVFSGSVSSGLGEGAYYVSEYAVKIKEKIGYTPYPGTLNLKVGVRPPLPPDAEVVAGFHKEDRSFGEVTLYPTELSAGRRKTPAHLIVPDRTHHRDEMEFIARGNLRKKLGLKDGATVKVKLV